MGGIAAIARAAGQRVSGCDANVYPPMSEQLAALDIDLIQGYGADQLALAPDLWVIGNVVSRGNPLLEAILDSGQRYVSGPQWLAEHFLGGRQVIAVAGTHGKTTTTAMIVHLLDRAGLAPGWLVGGVPADGRPSADAGQGRHFVIEADEYDTAFFDKRSKFVHYRPRVAVLNNLEFDHADIFDNLAQIQTQFHHLVRTIPGSGLILHPADCIALDEVLARGCWSRRQRFGPGGDWQLADVVEQPASSQFTVIDQGVAIGRCTLAMPGAHNRLNALAAIAAAVDAGVPPADALVALADFAGVKRRLEVRGIRHGVTVIDDFAHHPTAIAMTIAGLRERMGDTGRILALIEPRSNTMRLGAMKDSLLASVSGAEHVMLFDAGFDWQPAQVFAALGERFFASASVDELVRHALALARPGDHLLVMSNGGFGGIHAKLLDALAARPEPG